MQKKIQVDFPSEFEATYTFFPRNQVLMKVSLSPWFMEKVGYMTYI